MYSRGVLEGGEEFTWGFVIQAGKQAGVDRYSIFITSPGFISFSFLFLFFLSLSLFLPHFLFLFLSLFVFVPFKINSLSRNHFFNQRSKSRLYLPSVGESPFLPKP